MLASTNPEEPTMDVYMKLMASAREADVQRSAYRRRVNQLLATCRRRILGIFSVRQPCTPC
jgi:hypothetical protein